MALSEKQIENIVDYFNQRITDIVNDDNVDIENDKHLQRLFIQLDEMYKQINLTMQDVIPPAIYTKYLQGLKSAQRLLSNAGLNGISLSNEYIEGLVKAPIHLEAINNIVSDTLSDLSSAFRTANFYGHRELDKAIEDVKRELTDGLLSGMTTKQITKRVGQKFGKRGMTSFVTKDGKHLPLDFYAKTITRTKIQTAENHAHLNRYKEQNVKHVYVTGNIPTCGECIRYRGIVFATSRGDKFPYINLFKTFPKHPNCRCNFRPWIMKFKSDDEVAKELENAKSFDPDKDTRTEEEKRKYNANQKAKAKARNKRLKYNKVQSILGKDGPQSFKEFKNASKKQYHDWVAQMNKMYAPDNIHVDKVPDVPKQIDYKSVDYTTSDNFDNTSNDYAQSIFDKMNNLEKAALREYTHDDYVTINKYMRDKHHDNLKDNEVTLYPEDLGYIKDFADSIEQSFSKYDIQLQEDATLYRGIKDIELKHMAKHIERQSNGSMQFTLDNFKSTSSLESQTDLFANEGEGWVMEIKARKGSRVLSLQNISGIRTEREYLIANGQKFEIDRIDSEMRRVYVYLI